MLQSLHHDNQAYITSRAYGITVACEGHRHVRRPASHTPCNCPCRPTCRASTPCCVARLWRGTARCKAYDMSFKRAKRRGRALKPWHVLISISVPPLFDSKRPAAPVPPALRASAPCWSNGSRRGMGPRKAYIMPLKPSTHERHALKPQHVISSNLPGLHVCTVKQHICQHATTTPLGQQHKPNRLLRDVVHLPTPWTRYWPHV